MGKAFGLGHVYVYTRSSKPHGEHALSPSVSTYLLSRLQEWGVEKVFAYPGDGINGILAAWVEADSAPKFIQARHEEMAAFEAVGYAKFSGQLGVCMATSGPGAIHLLNGLYDAKLDHVPVVAIVGQTDRTAMGGSYQQEVDLASLVQGRLPPVRADGVGARAAPEPDRPRLPHGPRHPVTDLHHRALRRPGARLRAAGSRLQDGSVEPRDLAGPRCRPTTPAIRQAAEILNAGSKVAILVGQGARGAREEVTEVADLLGAGVAKALLGKDVLSDDLPWVTGSIGLLGTRPSYELMMDCDTVAHRRLELPLHAVHAAARPGPSDPDRHRRQLHRHALPLRAQHRGRCRLGVCRRCCRCSTRRPTGTGATRSRSNVSDWWDTMQRQAMTDSDRDGMVNPQRLVWELSARLPTNAIVAADSGSAANWYARHLKLRGEQRGSLSGTLATMGPGVPYVIGAKFAHPDRPAIALVGDGAMQMNGMAELITVKRYWQEWSDPRLIVAVLHNNDLNQVTWEMRARAALPSSPIPRTSPTSPTPGSRPASACRRSRCARPTTSDRPGTGAGRGPTHRARRLHRSRRPAHPTPRHLRPDEERRPRHSWAATPTPGACSRPASDRRPRSSCRARK